jgi:hypothetical protein
MLNDGEQGIFEEYLDNYGEVKVEWIWCEGDDWEFDGYFDVFISCGELDITTTFPKQHLITSTNASKNAQGMNHPAANVPHLFSTV